MLWPTAGDVESAPPGPDGRMAGRVTIGDLWEWRTRRTRPAPADANSWRMAAVGQGRSRPPAAYGGGWVVVVVLDVYNRFSTTVVAVPSGWISRVSPA